MSQPLVNLPPIPIKNNLKTTLLRSNLKTAIVADLKEKGLSSTMTEMKLHPDLTKHICIIVENSVKNNKKKKIDKKQLVIDVLAELFPLTASDKEVIGKAIDSLIANKSIKKKTMKLLFGSLVNTVLMVLNVI